MRPIKNWQQSKTYRPPLRTKLPPLNIDCPKCNLVCEISVALTEHYKHHEIILLRKLFEALHNGSQTCNYPYNDEHEKAKESNK